MQSGNVSKFPVFVMCGGDYPRRKLLEDIDPEQRYKTKALLPFLGKRLIDWQLDELAKSEFVEGLYLLGLSEADAQFDFLVQYVPVETISDFSDKLLEGLDYLENLGKSTELIVVSSCDAPGIRVEEIDAFFKLLMATEGYEFYLSLVPEDVIEAEFPGSGRVVARFADGNVIPGELYALSPRAIRIQQDVIKELGNRRRQINRHAQKIGMGPILRFVGKRPQTWILIPKYLLGAATLENAERAVSRAFDCRTKGLLISHAGFGMDMDLPEDYERLQTYVQKIKVDKA
jgi:GTP:adenosylcobinamide-phosphate guanylyltransferase